MVRTVSAWLSCLLAQGLVAQGALPGRTGDPVVLSGANLPTLIGLPVDAVVAFRYADGWEQIPVQIDERTVVDFGVVYALAPIGFTTPAYADPMTYTGADPDPTFDDDDELVFMARDAGVRVGTRISAPSGTALGIGLEVEVVDPLTAAAAYVYLFHGDSSISPDAGEDYVTYTFNLLAGDYIPNYNTAEGPNPEDSEALSAYYRTHFSDRWIRDELSVFTGESMTIDILDRHTNRFGPGDCRRSEDIFCLHEGAFFTNKDGAVRAIRSYMGASSGPLTQREHIFYERRQDIVTYLRVHEIPGIMDLYDYSPAATGMSYYNDLNMDGVLIDGLYDVLSFGSISWEMVTGEQGSLIILHSVETDIDTFAYTSFYSDSVDPDPPPCTGDAFEYGTSGLWIDMVIPNTDPYFGVVNTFASRRTVYYEAPNQTVDTATLRFEQARQPLQVSTRPYPPYKGDQDGNCRIDASDYAALASCLSGPGQCAGKGCDVFDWDGDCAVTLGDFTEFQSDYTGSYAVLPGCYP